MPSKAGIAAMLALLNWALTYDDDIRMKVWLPHKFIFLQASVKESTGERSRKKMRGPG